MTKIPSRINIFGEHEYGTVEQLRTCVDAEDGARGVLCADGHVGYSMPIGGVAAYKNYISPSGVGYDIACGNMAVRTGIHFSELDSRELTRIANEIETRVSFGVGRKNNKSVDHPVLDAIADEGVAEQKQIQGLAASQLGTVGSGNHYVDILEDESGSLWVGVHFGSRGFGHKTASGFLNLAAGREFFAHGGGEHMFSPPVLLDINQPLGQDYIQAMTIAGQYAYAGRETVVSTVLDILGATALETIHNHHNFAWRETHPALTGELTDYWVVRKGATPAGPGVKGFVGGSMGDMCVILEGVDGIESARTLYSTVHGAGRIMSRNQAIKGTHEWVCPYVATLNCTQTFKTPKQPPKDLKCPVHGTALEKVSLAPPVDFEAVKQDLTRIGVILRGAGPDESPQVYRPLQNVLDAMNVRGTTVKVLHKLMPKIVVMAGKEVRDPYKD